MTLYYLLLRIHTGRNYACWLPSNVINHLHPSSLIVHYNIKYMNISRIMLCVLHYNYGNHTASILCIWALSCCNSKASLLCKTENDSMPWRIIVDIELLTSWKTRVIYKSEEVLQWECFDPLQLSLQRQWFFVMDNRINQASSYILDIVIH